VARSCSGCKPHRKATHHGSAARFRGHHPRDERGAKAPVTGEGGRARAGDQGSHRHPHHFRRDRRSPRRHRLGTHCPGSNDLRRRSCRAEEIQAAPSRSGQRSASFGKRSRKTNPGNTQETKPARDQHRSRDEPTRLKRRRPRGTQSRLHDHRERRPSRGKPCAGHEPRQSGQIVPRQGQISNRSDFRRGNDRSSSQKPRKRRTEPGDRPNGPCPPRSRQLQQHRDSVRRNRRRRWTHRCRGRVHR
jgi:hypothetical protein